MVRTEAVGVVAANIRAIRIRKGGTKVESNFRDCEHNRMNHGVVRPIRTCKGGTKQIQLRTLERSWNSTTSSDSYNYEGQHLVQRERSNLNDRALAENDHYPAAVALLVMP